jgi:predicted RNA-binding protein with PIN domain
LKLVDERRQLKIMQRKNEETNMKFIEKYARQSRRVDKNNEFILVADTDNDRIVILNRSLKCDARELNVMMSVDGGLQQPQCLYFNSSQNRLFVGESGGRCRVLVFDNHWRF